MWKSHKEMKKRCEEKRCEEDHLLEEMCVRREKIEEKDIGKVSI